MFQNRINTHPILKIQKKEKINFFWNGKKLTGLKNETISSALIANNIYIFSQHHKDKSPQGIFCANGQCSQCMVIANDINVKSCMTIIKNNMHIKPLKKLPKIKINNTSFKINKIKKYNIPVLVVGGGPAGLSAAIELGKSNIKTIIVDDKNCLGGKLILQTHKFFGSVNNSYAGTRGFKIAEILKKKLLNYTSIDIWLNSTVVGIFSDGIVGILNNSIYKEIIPKKILITTGAREKMFSFPGNTLPGIYGAGAFQTLINRDLIKTSNKILIIGGGNVGLIAGYHAIQAGIKVVGLVEAMANIGGYKVHLDKLKRIGIPIFTRHTVISAYGNTHVNSVTIAKLNSKFEIEPNTYRTFKVDSVLIAIGLEKVNELSLKAKKWNMNVHTAGDSNEIAEASAAIFAGKIEGLKISNDLTKQKKQIPIDWNKKINILKSKPGITIKYKNIQENTGVFPIFHCYQEIPCNPCTSICPNGAIKTIKNKITGLPYITNNALCKGCMACVAICPGLAITLVDYRKDSLNPIITIPYEMQKSKIKLENKIYTTSNTGDIITKCKVKHIINNKKKHPGTLLVQVKTEKKFAKKISGILTQEKQNKLPTIQKNASVLNKAIVCRCERVSAEEILNAIHNGITDLNHMKAINRAGMGACGSKTCRSIIWNLFKKEGFKQQQITDRVDRPLFVEVSIGALAGIKGKNNNA